MKTTKSLMAASFAVLLLAACGSSGLGDVFGGGTGGNGQTYQLRGVVDSVDPNNRSLYLTNVNGYTSMLSNGGGGTTARVYFDDSTPVDYQGRSYRPEDLERGDEVTVQVDESNNRLIARSMTVTYDTSSGTSSSTYPNGNQQSTIRGTVYSIDSARRTLQLESPSWVSGFQRNPGGNRVTVAYDTNTSVDVQGRLYPVSNLERGDLVEVQVYGSGSALQAERIVLVRDVNR